MPAGLIEQRGEKQKVAAYSRLAQNTLSGTAMSEQDSNLDGALKAEGLKLVDLRKQKEQQLEGEFTDFIRNFAAQKAVLSGGQLKAEIDSTFAATTSIVEKLIDYRMQLAIKVPKLLHPNYLNDLYIRLEHEIDLAPAMLCNRYKSQPFSRLTSAQIEAAMERAEQKASDLKSGLHNKIQTIELEGALGMHKPSEPDYENGMAPENDPMYEAAVRVVLEMGTASTSTLHRRLKLGFGRAARVLDRMQSEGIIGPPDGSDKPRPVQKRPDWLKEPLSAVGPQPKRLPSKEPVSQVFLCHSSTDKDSVRELYKRLTQDGFSPWLDEESLLPGQEWEYEIRTAVRKSEVVLVCLSRASITKEGFVQKEIRIALDVADEKPEGAIYIIPLRLEDCPVPERLKKWHWVDIFSSNGYERLLRSLRNRPFVR